MKARPSVEKRRKERARQEKKQEKAEKRVQRKTDKSSKDGDGDEVDPDIAHIVPGPQPHPFYEDEEERP